VTLHPQIAALLERAAKSPFPAMNEVPAHVARRIYRETRAVLAPQPPEAEVRLQIFEGRVAVRGYRPPGRSGRLPALLYFHGGGWTIGDLDTHDVLCRQLAVGADCAVFSIDYCLAPEHAFPAAADDCWFATRHVFTNASSLGVDANRIAVGGDSAGGNLAAVVALQARDAGGPALCHQLLIYPATDQRCGFPSHERNGAGYLLTKEMIRYFRRCYLPREADWADWRASPLLAASHANLPSAFVLTAGYDPLVDEGKAYAKRLEHAGVAVTYREYGDMVHGFVLFGGVVDTANAAVAECCKALRAAYQRVSA
jgi:acetyl esterase